RRSPPLYPKFSQPADPAAFPKPEPNTSSSSSRMSVIFSSGKSAAARMKEGKKKKPTKVARPRTAMPVNSYMPTSETAVWNTKLHGVNYSIALSKDSLELWCNDQLLQTVSDFSDTGSTLDFELDGQKGRISIVPGGRGGTRYELTLNGRPVEAAREPPEGGLRREKTRLH
ncbi:hypothetical protein BOX15_Mlig027449g2, partial [Macrostomum lignano]